MKKHFLFFNVFILFCLTWSHIAVAKKRYRYIKREHGLKFHWTPQIITFRPAMSIPANIGGAYAYNWRGIIEVGPYFQVNGQLESFTFPSLAGGLLVEYNIIKNIGKRKLIPALGLDLGVHKGKINEGVNNLDAFYLAGGLYGALKAFVGKRTPITVKLGYKLFKPMGAAATEGLTHAAIFSVGFSYYFDFY